MKTSYKMILAFLSLLFCVLCVPSQALADAQVEEEDTSYERYIAFGADLRDSEKASVLQQFGITEADLVQYKVIEITNEQEHEYLGDYIDASVIGKRALSSVMVVKTEEGSGIEVCQQYQLLYFRNVLQCACHGGAYGCQCQGGRAVSDIWDFCAGRCDEGIQYHDGGRHFRRDNGHGDRRAGDDCRIRRQHRR